MESVTSAGTPVTWLPVPSGIPVVDDERASAAIHSRYANGHALVGHFGTYGRHMRTLLVGLHSRAGGAMSTVGCCCSAAAARRWRASSPPASRRSSDASTVPARCSADDVSRHMSACDVMLQPYPDGISSRRTSAMAALSHARPVVTTSGPLTEDVWETSGAAVLVPVADGAGLAEATAALATNPERRARLAEHAWALYRDQFALLHTIATLRSTP